MSETSDGYVVTQTIEEAHPLHPTYPLLQGDLLVRDSDGTFAKVCPGLHVSGFVLKQLDLFNIHPVKFISRGLDYEIL